MIPQMILPAERFPADVARVRPLVGVRSLVYEQVVALGELSVAELADELFLRPLAGQPPREERGGRLDLRERVMHALMALVVIRMGHCLRATAPYGQQRGTSQPIVEERGLIALAGRLLESRVQLLRPDPPGRRDLLLRVDRSVQRWRRVRRCQRLHLRLHGPRTHRKPTIYIYIYILFLERTSITLDLSYPISRSRRYVYILHMTPDRDPTKENEEEGREVALFPTVQMLARVAGREKKKKKRGQRWLESRRGTKCQRTVVEVPGSTVT